MNKEKTDNTYIEADDVRPHSSFELKHTSRGTSVKIKIYTGEDATLLDNAQKECERRYKSMLDKYTEVE